MHTAASLGTHGWGQHPSALVAAVCNRSARAASFEAAGRRATAPQTPVRATLFMDAGFASGEPSPTYSPMPSPPEELEMHDAEVAASADAAAADAAAQAAAADGGPVNAVAEPLDGQALLEDALAMASAIKQQRLGPTAAAPLKIL